MYILQYNLTGEKIIQRTLDKLWAEEQRDKEAARAEEATEMANVAEQEKEVAIFAKQKAEEVAEGIAEKLGQAMETLGQTKSALGKMQKEYERLKNQRPKKRGGLFGFIGHVLDHVIGFVERF